MIAFTIPGPPQGKARARTCRNGHSYTPKNTVLYENLVKTEFLRQCGREQRIRAEQNRPALGRHSRDLRAFIRGFQFPQPPLLFGVLQAKIM